MKHWVERIADDLAKKDLERHVIASGTSISGSIHIGNSCDVFIANAITKALNKSKTTEPNTKKPKSLNKENIFAKTIWIADDHDPLRKIPHPLPADYQKYLGIPYSKIPCPEACCTNFVEHFEKPFLRALEEFEIDIEIHSGEKMYKEGLYNDYIRKALNKAPEIREIFNQFREKPLEEDWLPYNPICESCGRVNTTYAYGFNGDMVYYRCECGNDSKMDIKSGEGKLTWRVEWAARWKIFQVTCEPFGKDHAAYGGSYDVSKLISRQIFEYDAPYPVPYEWITLKGEAMSKSRGVFFTPGQWLEIAHPETLNYFIFRSKPMKHKDFNPEMPFLDFIDQYDRVERIYFDEEKTSSEKEVEKLKKIYEISQIRLPPNMPFQPPYRFLTVACQIAPDDTGKVFEMLKKNSQLPEQMKNIKFEDLSREELDKLDMRLNHVKNWLEKYAPEFVKFHVQEEMPRVQLSGEQNEFLLKLADILEEREFSPEELHDEMYVLLRELDMKPQKAFQAIYKVIIGKKQGPRAASFVLSLDKKFVIKRLRMVA